MLTQTPWCITRRTTVFVGSGTTGVACLQENRNFIGIEKEPKYFDIARQRIEAVHAQPTLFEVEYSQ